MTTVDRPRSPEIRPAFSLDEKYTRQDGVIYLSGVQALVRLPLDQRRADLRRGLDTATFISGYRGSPLGVYDIELGRAGGLLAEHHVVHQPGLNEELAATAVFGSQMSGLYPGARYDGVLGIWYGKGPGVDRTGDAFKHANHAGIGRNGGVLALGGDDPSSKSSTLPSDSVPAFYDALMPVLYPGSVQEILDFGLHGFMLSRTSGLWAAMKITTNVADGTATAQVSPNRISPVIPTVELDGRPYVPQLDVNLLAPANLEMERTIHYGRLELARRYAWENDLNRIVTPTRDAWLGIMTAGKTYYDVKEALDELGLDDAALERYGIRVLKIGMLFPLEPRIVREFARGLEEILVVEEKRAFLETFARDVLYSAPDRPAIVGKSDEEGQPLVPAYGELDSEQVARAIARRVLRKVRVASVEARLAYVDGLKARTIPLISTPRTAYFCSGCPHNTGALVPDGAIVSAGIGCHTMAKWMDPERFGTIIGMTQMGSEGAQWIGAAPFTDTPHLFQNIGDGTLFHSGQLAINFAVAAGVSMTYKILYNSAVAMTGGQDAVGQISVPDLTRRLQAEGVKRIIVTTDEPDKYRGVRLAEIAEVRDRDGILHAQEELAATQGVTVLIHDQRCAAEKRRLRKRGKADEPEMRVFINERVCEGCGDCGHESNCLSVQPLDTEFGRKTSIHQSSCNKDYSCLKGDCPAFVTVEPVSVPAKAKASRPVPVAPSGIADPEQRVPLEGFALHMMGIGGTGVVTVNQILGTAAMLDGLHVWGLDQTGLSQKGGPVVSDLRIGTRELDVSKVASGGADLYLGFDMLVAADPKNLATADPRRTIAVLSTSQVATGKMVADTSVTYPALETLLAGVRASTRREHNVYFDAEGISEALFGTHMPSNVLALGAAYQAGALPITAGSIESAIRLNGASVELNLQAFRWGRTFVADPSRVEAAVKQAQPAPAASRPGAVSPAARSLMQRSGATGELRRLLEIRIPELVTFQNAAYARRYVDVVRRVAEVERQRTPGHTRLAEAVARFLYKFMAYKDEYEVARLHLESVAAAKVSAQFGEDVRVSWNLHPPLLRALGREKKLKLGPWFKPGMQALRAMKVVRGTPLDPFGRTEVRQTERLLIAEYIGIIKRLAAVLAPENHARAVAIASLPDMVRGYEDLKLKNVSAYRAAVEQGLSEIGALAPQPTSLRLGELDGGTEVHRGATPAAGGQP